ncbi:CGNR zinc finger domain-containing protein [Longispora sp. K20-0274]|uniref:ABATE domain-containing protein n=1 Tax=Longispora sp. K20-0274 TaxID=3088255 RepID=UPI00399B1B48
MEADEPVPVRLMNTVWADRHGVHDALTTREELAAWLADTGRAPAATRVTKTDLLGYRELRAALRALAALLTGDDRPPAEPVGPGDAVAAVNAAAAASPRIPGLRLRDGALHPADATAGPTATAVLSAVAAEAVDLFTGEAARDLRACRAPGCVLYFLRDHPRREWCSVACGNRARAARHYRRHHPDTVD